MSLSANYIEKVYAGWLGKIIGVRHGGNIENWTYERIAKTFGEVTGYLHQFKNFAADDDTNGPLFFLRALEDYTHTEAITAEEMGLAWLNYAPDGHGFYWWGGYGKSSEHTAYLNLKNGIMAPRSGSIEQNGIALAEQIGGQIFSDVWGLILPGNSLKAAAYAGKMSSVSHDGNGKYGGMFIAACIAAAFEETNVERIIEAGLSVIPGDCEYTKMTRKVIAYYRRKPENWRDCFHYIKENFGYHLYPGHCHIIPNSAVIILSLLYGEGDFSKSINICNMCGWDTDCNVANVGTIIGVKNGLEGIDPAWRLPINDFLCCSSVIGTLNILDIPWCASYIARLGYRIAEEKIPEAWEVILEEQSTKFHFEYPGSTHGFRFDSDADWQMTGKLENTKEAAAEGTRSLKVIYDKVRGGYAFRAFHKTYYRPDDFNDSRYDPSFTPILYPGQTITAKAMVPAWIPFTVKARLYVREGNANERLYGDEITLTSNHWHPLSFCIPALSGACIEEAGIEFIPLEGWDVSLVAYIDSFDFSGLPDYRLDFAKERLEKWNGLHIEVSQCTYGRGIWTLEDGELSGSYSGESAECYTGDLKWRDYSYKAVLIPKIGRFHNVLFRVQGAIRSYAAGFAPDGKFALYKNNNGYSLLESVPSPWVSEMEYEVEVEVTGNRYKVKVNGEQLIDYSDSNAPYLHGQIGFGNSEGSHTHFKSFALKGIWIENKSIDSHNL